MYSNSDFEKVWFLYKTEGEPKGISINSFCVNQGVSYNKFNDGFRKTHRAVNYILDDKEAFQKSLLDGRIEMHNNAIELMFRHIAIGKRNWLHTDSQLRQKILLSCTRCLKAVNSAM